MDRVKAIEVLKPLVASYVDHANISMKEEDDDIAEALEMAIEALKALDVPDTNVGDLISRQAAIENSFEVYTKEYGWCEVVGVDAISELPSAQPEIIRCRDCKHGRGDVFDRGWWCDLHPSFDVDGNDYCSYAERRTDA